MPPTLTPAVNEHDHAQGAAHAPLTLVEYGDFQCPSCGQAYPIVKAIQQHFGDGLRFVFRHFPLEQHPMAEPAAEAAEFAAAHKKFWQMHDALFENQADLSPELFAELAAQLHLNENAFAEAVENGTFADRIDADLESGEDSGVAGTPTFFINGQKHEGSFSSQALIGALEAARRA